MDETTGVLSVAVIGAESTGKTTLCRWLAKRLNGLHLEETLRHWVVQRGRTPRDDEQLDILYAQQRQERAGLQQASRNRQQWLFCDSAPLVTAAYSHFYFNDSSLDMLATAHHQAHYCATLFCVPQGLDWVAEPGQRDGPQAREAVHQTLLALIQSAQTDQVILLSGGLMQRYKFALAFLKRLHLGFARGPETS
ncbi:MAG: ATP-binding protein [Bordetella sp.]